jgi:hypothetical protein
MTGVTADAHGQSATRTVIHLSLSDTIPGYGPVTDLTFSISRIGVGSSNICAERN